MSIGSDGRASVASGFPFEIEVADVDGQRNGVMFYGLGSFVAPWGSGGTSYLCVNAPRQRTGVSNTGGTTAVCDGRLAVDFNAFIAASPNALGSPFAAGQVYFAQGWMRDPGAPKDSNLSNGLQFPLGP